MGSALVLPLAEGRGRVLQVDDHGGDLLHQIADGLDEIPVHLLDTDGTAVEDQLSADAVLVPVTLLLGFGDIDEQ